MSTAGAGAAEAAQDRLVGSWKLQRWVSVGDDGSVALPFGEHPEGILVYAPDGTMITTLAPADRPPLSSLDPITGGSPDERLLAAETFVAYSGRFVDDGTDVTHIVEMSLYPNWVGTRQLRHVRLSDDGHELELSTDPFTLAGRRSVQRLTWVRVRSHRTLSRPTALGGGPAIPDAGGGGAVP